MPTRHDSPGGAWVPFFEFLDDRGGADMQDARGVTNPAGIHGPINNLIFDVLRLAGIGIVKEKRAPLARGLSAAIALLTLWSSPMSHDIRALAMWAMQDLGDHTSSLSWR